MDEFHVGYCITSHGFGHAARSVAVMEALCKLVNVRFTLATMVPEWFFLNSFSGSSTLHSIQTDVGLVQVSALEVDLPATIRELYDFYPLHKERTESLSTAFSDCQLVISDIAPIGIAAARLVGIPSVLLENFTWDWIYESYLQVYPELKNVISDIRETYSKADIHIQASPVCSSKKCDLVTSPVARKIRNERDVVRKKLSVDKEQRLVLVSMGGGGMQKFQPCCHNNCGDTVFLIPGMSGTDAGQEHLRFLPEDSGFFHPDLVAASDAVIGKVGYSTLAEIYHAGVPFGYIRRNNFRESEPLVQFIEENMNGVEIRAEEFLNGNWAALLPRLFSMKHAAGKRVNGADECAELLASLLNNL